MCQQQNQNGFVSSSSGTTILHKETGILKIDAKIIDEIQFPGSHSISALSGFKFCWHIVPKDIQTASKNIKCTQDKITAPRLTPGVDGFLL